MREDYKPEHFWKLYKNLPEDLQDAIFSVETADSIYDICERNDINEVSLVAKIVGRILLGVLPPDGLLGILEKDLKLDADTAENATREIKRFILFPVKKSLGDLYESEIQLRAKKGDELAAFRKRGSSKTEGKPVIKSVPSSDSDTYREIIDDEE